MSEKREGLCEVCDRGYPVWFAPNPLWNATVRDNRTGDEWSFLCPTCFGNIAAERGVHTGSWVLTNETTPYEEAAGLAYTLREIVIQGDEALAQFRGPDREPQAA